MNEMPRDAADYIGQVVRREIEADGHVTVRAAVMQGEVSVGQTVYVHHADGSMPLVVTDIEDGWVTAHTIPDVQ